MTGNRSLIGMFLLAALVWQPMLKGATLENDLAYLVTVSSRLEARIEKMFFENPDFYLAHTLSVFQRTLRERRTELTEDELKCLAELTKKLKHELNFASVYEGQSKDDLELYARAASSLDSALTEILSPENPNRGLRERVVKWANEAVGVSTPLYGVQTHISITAHPDYPDMFPGYLSCARVCSAILKKAGAGKGIHSACLRLDKALSGWRKVKVDDLSKGDVVFWARNAQDFRPRHVGIHIGWFMGVSFTVDNNSLLGRVVKRPMSRPEWNLYHGRRTPK